MKINHRPRPIRVAGFTLVIMALLLIPARSHLAQTTEPQKPTPGEVQLLKERLLQLEQTVELLKAQITSMDDAHKKTDVATGEKVAASATISAAPPETAAKPQDDEKQGREHL